ncbi:hypothetical protein FW320_27820 [Azospirillum sp. Vi22]|nr:hypothetical protein [Azospirillum baldaniorum]
MRFLCHLEEGQGEITRNPEHGLCAAILQRAQQGFGQLHGRSPVPIGFAGRKPAQGDSIASATAPRKNCFIRNNPFAPEIVEGWRPRLISPLPSREREGAHAQRGKGEGVAKGWCLDPRTTLTRRLRRHPLPGRERGFSPNAIGPRDA